MLDPKILNPRSEALGRKKVESGYTGLSAKERVPVSHIMFRF